MHAQPAPDFLPEAQAALQTDARLWEAFKEGSVEAYGRIYHSLVQDLFNFGSNLVADQELIRDCIQDLFVYIWDSKERLGPTDNIKFYLFTALKRRILQKTGDKQKNHLVLAAQDQWGRQDLQEETWPVSGQAEETREACLEKALLALSPRQREAIYLRFYDKLSYAQVAEIMSLTVPSTYSLIARAMEVLRGQLSLLWGQLLWLVFS
ncbi:MAG: RNA polymerase sigma factor [Adhaeribacter sp.]